MEADEAPEIIPALQEEVRCMCATHANEMGGVGRIQICCKPEVAEMLVAMMKAKQTANEDDQQLFEAEIKLVICSEL